MKLNNVWHWLGDCPEIFIVIGSSGNLRGPGGILSLQALLGFSEDLILIPLTRREFCMELLVSLLPWQNKLISYFYDLYFLFFFSSLCSQIPE